MIVIYGVSGCFKGGAWFVSINKMTSKQNNYTVGENDIGAHKMRNKFDSNIARKS